jgi:hypothetical protein
MNLFHLINGLIFPEALIIGIASPQGATDWRMGLTAYRWLIIADDLVAMPAMMLTIAILIQIEPRRSSA